MLPTNVNWQLDIETEKSLLIAWNSIAAPSNHADNL